MNNQTRGNIRRRRSRRGHGQYPRGNMDHPQNGGNPGQAPVPFPPPPLPPPSIVAYPAYELPYAPPSQPYIYSTPVVCQNTVPLGYYPYEHPVPAHMPPPPQGQVNQVVQGQEQVPGQHHGSPLNRHHRSRSQVRGRGNGRGNRGQPNRRLVRRGNCSPRPQPLQSIPDSLALLVALLNSPAALPAPLEQSSDLDSRGVKQEDTEDESTPVAQNIGSTEIKREPVIKQEPQ
ncbi:hypothetical protein F25303_9509 [Fusarium sp. NRRL 25303]|nr:hypothetical protein F25303_9509 [Fusarium sp. NRRL 25303]